MRITKNDIPSTTYTATETLDSEGVSTLVWVAGSTSVYADFQPVDGRTDLAQFGIDPATTGVKRAYSDKGAFALGQVVVNGLGTYQCRGLSPWYSHDETVWVPWVGQLGD